MRITRSPDVPSVNTHRLRWSLAVRAKYHAIRQDIRRPGRAPERIPPSACHGSAQRPRERLTATAVSMTVAPSLTFTTLPRPLPRLEHDLLGEWHGTQYITYLR